MTDFYVFQAAHLCALCGQDALEDTPKPAGFDPDDEHTWDSGDYPKGPYVAEHQETDCPAHCDHCGSFIPMGLTSEGKRYVLEARAKGNSMTAQVWAEHYDYLF